MSVIVECDSCGTRLKAPEKLLGKRIRCKCGAAVAMPPDPTEPDVADLSGLISGITAATSPCPSCGASMDDAAVICVGCGFNKKTGKRIHSAVKESSGDSSAKNKKEPKKSQEPPKRGDPEREAKTALIWKLSKLAIAAAVIFGAVWFIKGAIKMSPGEQAGDMLKVIYPGMTIEEVVKAMGKPPREVYTMVDAQSFGLSGTLKEARIAYADNFLEHHGPKKLENGFKFVYKYSDRDQLHVQFTPDGKVDGVEKVDPMAALGL